MAENPANSSAIRNWLEHYNKIMIDTDESAKEGAYGTMGAHPHACKFRYPVSTYPGTFL